MRKLALACAALAVVGIVAVGPIASLAKPAAQLSAQRLDPYKTFKFRLKWDGRVVAGVDNVAVPDAIKHRDGGDPSTSHKSPGRTKYEAITLERGLTQDHTFAAWASGGPKSHGRSVHDIDIVAVDQTGKPVHTVHVHLAWVSVYEGKADAKDGSGAAITRLRLENEGWEQ